MLHGSILTADELLQITGYSRDGDLKSAFTRNGISWLTGKGGRPWTTLDLINKAGGLTPVVAGNEPAYNPDDA